MEHGRRDVETAVNSGSGCPVPLRHEQMRRPCASVLREQAETRHALDAAQHAHDHDLRPALGPASKLAMCSGDVILPRLTPRTGGNPAGNALWA